MASVIERERILEISGKCDVLVAGGGIAGVAAALAAARNGAKVTLVEREFGLGGLATLGLIAIYLPLCDGEGHKVCAGICEELFMLSIKHGIDPGHPVPQAWLENGSREERKKIRYMAQYNPVFFALEMEKLLISEGVHILYGTQITDVIKDGRKIIAAVIENKSGRSAVKAQVYIDATGDADLFRQAQLETSVFSRKNALAGWYYYTDSESDVKLSMFGLADVRSDNEDDKNEREATISDFRFSGVDGDELSEAVQRSHGLMLEEMLRRKDRDDKYQPVSVASIPQTRMSRKITGDAVLRITDDRKYCERSIGMTGDWCRRGPVYEIPFEALYTSECVNLLAAGRNISTDEDVWNATRVIPPCAVTGEAAGTAASMTCDMTELDIKDLQEKLRKQGVLIHTEDAFQQ